MKKALIFFPLFLFSSVLSNLEEKSLFLNKEKSIKEAKITRDSWINPILLKYSITQDNIIGTKTITKTFTISINQPIFKSGAIIYSIKYANDLKNLNILNIALQKKTLIKNALDLAFDYKITKLNEEILKLKIKNALIDVKKKKEEYKNGTLDMSFLNNSIIALNSLKLSLEDIKESLANIKFNFKKISDMNIEKVRLNLFKIISIDEFLDKNIELKAKKLSKKVNKDLYKMQIGDTLITISLNGSYNYQDISYSSNTLQDDKKNFYSIGVGVSMPLDVNMKRKIEKAKLNYLLSNIDFLQKRRELINDYKSVIASIETMRKKIKIYQDNVKLYNELINSTKNDILAGSATKEDLEILENSKRVNLIQIAILRTKIQKKLLELYYKLVSFSN